MSNPIDHVDDQLTKLVTAVGRMMLGESIQEVTLFHELSADAVMYIKRRDKVLVEALLGYIKANPSQEIPQEVIDLGIITEVK